MHVVAWGCTLPAHAAAEVGSRQGYGGRMGRSNSAMKDVASCLLPGAASPAERAISGHIEWRNEQDCMQGFE